MILPAGALQARLQALLTWWDCGPAAVRIDCYDGAPPTPGASTGSTPAVTFVFARPLPVAGADGSVTLLPVESPQALRSCELRWCRVVRGDGTWGGDDLVTTDAGVGLIRVVGDAGSAGGVLVRAGGLVVLTGGALVG